MSKRIKYICKRCSYAEPTNWKDNVKRHLDSIIYFNGLIFTILILAFLYLLQNAYIMSEVTRGIWGFDLVGATLNYKAYGSSDELRALALNITYDCRNSSDNDKLERCYAVSIYSYIRDNIDYGYGSDEDRKIYTPMETINTSVGDCKNQAYLFVSIASQVGLSAKVKCNGKHCFPIVTFRDGEVFVTDPVYKIYGYWDDWKWAYE